MYRSILLLLSCALLGGCSSHGNWGADTTLVPGWQTIKHAAIHAAVDPHTWVPLAGAVVFSIDDFDERTVDWAGKHTPLSGDVDDAEDLSDLSRSLSRANYLVTALAVPSGAGRQMVWNKARGLGMGLVTIGINDAVTNALKSATDRQRPNRVSGSNRHDNSFPSLHTSAAATTAALAVRNIEHMTLSRTQKRVWQWSSYSLAAVTGWARVEAQRHYPTDVLAGYALGNFIGAFMNDAFITPGFDGRVALEVEAQPGERLLVGLRWAW